MFIIQDWAGNALFNEKQFNDWDVAEEFLSEFFDKNNMEYEEYRQEYFIIEVE